MFEGCRPKKLPLHISAISCPLSISPLHLFSLPLYRTLYQTLSLPHVTAWPLRRSSPKGAALGCTRLQPWPHNPLPRPHRAALSSAPFESKSGRPAPSAWKFCCRRCQRVHQTKAAAIASTHSVWPSGPLRRENVRSVARPLPPLRTTPLQRTPRLHVSNTFRLLLKRERARRRRTRVKKRKGRKCRVEAVEKRAMRLFFCSATAVMRWPGTPSALALSWRVCPRATGSAPAASRARKLRKTRERHNRDSAGEQKLDLRLKSRGQGKDGAKDMLQTTALLSLIALIVAARRKKRARRRRCEQFLGGCPVAKSKARPNQCAAMVKSIRPHGAWDERREGAAYSG